MKFVLAAVLCALSVKTVLVMPVAEPGVQSDGLAVVPLEKSAPILETPHILRRETSETPAPEVSVHHEGETPEEHAKHAHLPTARLAEDAGKPASVKTEESKPLVEDVKLVEAAADLPEKKEEVLLKNAEVIEDAIATKAAAAEIITPVETLAPIPAVPVAPVPVENKVEPQVTEGKNAPAKDISSELKEGVKSEEPNPEAADKIEEPQPLAKSSPIPTKSEAPAVVEPVATVAAVTESESSPKDEKKIEAVVAESEQKATEQPKEEVKEEAADKTDRVTRGTDEAVDSVKDASATASTSVLEAAKSATDAIAEAAASVAEPIAKMAVDIKEEKTDRVTRGTDEAVDAVKDASAAVSTSASEAAEAATDAVASVAASVADPVEKMVVDIKEEKTELPEKKLDVVEPVGILNDESKPEMAKSAEPTLTVEASETVANVAEKIEKVAEEGVSSVVKAGEQLLEAKSASADLEAQPEAQSSSSAAAAAAAAAPKPEPVVDTIKVKSESTDDSKESAEAVKVEDSSSSEEKSSEEDHSNEKLEKSVDTKSSDEPKKEESKVEELPKPQEIKEIKQAE